ncbi:outer membrane protein [Martelella limonii]|uniref:outer membrane protein n=1 Tax=Martelella limonii TaxID=1647649 RepID=UPI0015803C88|nr:porin family protein [Martelella limonii]
MIAAKTFWFALATTALVSSASLAQDLPESLQPLGNLKGPLNLVIPNYSQDPSASAWNGFYLKPNIGYETMSFDNTFLKDAGGITLGISGGYDFTFDRFLIGPSGEFNYNFTSGNQSSVNGGDNYKAFADFDGYVGGRTGFLLDRTLIYAIGGYAFTNTHVKNATLGISETDYMSGWTGGAGVEYLWSNTNGLRLEYRRVQYDSKRFSILPASDDKVSPNMDKLSIGFVRRF